jgi:putative SOS response-associated peptidase YedK
MFGVGCVELVTCGRVIQKSGPLRLAIVEGLDVSDSRLGNVPSRYNAAPSQELLVIRHNHETGERSLDLIKWGLTPYWCKDPRGAASPSTPRPRASLGFPCSGMHMPCGAASCPWTAFSSGAQFKGARKQPYAIAMKDGSPFGLAGLWEARLTIVK